VIVLNGHCRVDDTRVALLEPVPRPFLVLAARQIGAERPAVPQVGAKRPGRIPIPPLRSPAGQRRVLDYRPAERVSAGAVAVPARAGDDVVFGTPGRQSGQPAFVGRKCVGREGDDHWLARGMRPRVERAAEAEVLRHDRDDRGPALGGDPRRPVARAAVDEDHLQVAHPLLGGQDIQAAREVRRLVARG
jgi:hypothetical protein